MRELKFRAWDKKRNIMIGEDYPDNWGSEKQEYWADVFEISLTGITEITQNARFEIMQYTGLRDKDGKEIYEGDVLCWPKYEGTENQTRWPVEWDDERAQFTYWLPRMDAEVIGNIYENPGLIKNDR
jgi:uncharacterized phage protein (TIGR01671 family)